MWTSLHDRNTAFNTVVENKFCSSRRLHGVRRKFKEHNCYTGSDVNAALLLCVAGVIVLYRLYHNGILIYNSSTACNLTLSGLETWSAHELRLETCTSVGCTSSPSVLARTQESVPEGVIGLAVNVSSTRSVLVYWTPVNEPNGRLSYRVYFSGPFYAQQSTYAFGKPSVL